MERLWTPAFRRICISNTLMFFSLYMLVTVLPVEMVVRLGESLTKTGMVYLFFLAGMIFISPFLHYLADIYKRKYLCFWAYLIILLVTGIYPVVSQLFEMYVLSFIQGTAFGIASSTFVALSIDVLISEKRSFGNIRFRWFARMGMIIGIAGGSVIYVNFGFIPVILVAMGTGILGAFYLLFASVPFRAPIGVKMITLDRFFLPKGWPLFLNMVMASFAIGLLLPLIYYRLVDISLFKNYHIPYFLIVCLGFFLSLYKIRDLFTKDNMWRQVTTGLLMMVIALSLLILFDSFVLLIVSAILLGMGIGRINPVFIWMFIGLADHCERATANYTYLLSWEVGIAAGIFLACYLNDHASILLPYQIAMFSASLALIFFIVFSFPYYSNNKVR